MITVPTRIGIRVVCEKCGAAKQPHGRSAPMDSMYCDGSCPGYELAPFPGCLWWGETDANFGYESCDRATRAMTKEEIVKWKTEKEKAES